MMPKKILALLLAVMTAGVALPAKAWEWQIDPERKVFAETAESLNPGWRATDIVWFGISEGYYYRIILMSVSDSALRIREITAECEDETGERWQSRENAPVPLSEDGAERASAALAAFQPAPRPPQRAPPVPPPLLRPSPQ